MTPLSSQSAAVSLTIRDTPPAGVTVLSFEVTVTGAVLNPGNVQLLPHPKEIEVKQLETESAFLSTMNVPAGTYQSIMLSFANPELTILNQTGAAIGSCANNSVCELKPNAAGNVTFSSPPFPVTIQANSPTGLQVDVNLNNLINNSLGVDFNAPNAITVAQLPGQPAGELEEMDDLEGFVKSVDSANQLFVLTTPAGDFTIKVNAQTEFEDFDACTANPKNISCLQANQAVEVDLTLMAGGAMVAKKVELEEQVVDDELEGVIFKVDNATQFELVVLEELRDVAGVAAGNPIQVTSTGAQFQVDTDGLTIPSSSQLFVDNFNNATDTSQLLPGQVVEVRVKTATVMNGSIAVVTDRVRLRMSQFTGTISGISGNNFKVTPQPSLFTSNGINTIQVQTIPGETEFEGVTDISGLAVNNIVSLRGLLLKTGADPSANPPVLIAKKVRKRT